MGNFYVDVICRDPRYSLSRKVSDLALLEPTTRDLAKAMVADALGRGVHLMVYETFRSRSRQLALYDRGASHLREVGVHNYGLAFDLVRDLGDGEPSWKGNFSLIGVLARQRGLIWGGDWGDPSRKHSNVDVYHVQRCSLARQRNLFRGTWYPDASYNPLA